MRASTGEEGHTCVAHQSNLHAEGGGCCTSKKIDQSPAVLYTCPHRAAGVARTMTSVCRPSDSCPSSHRSCPSP